MRWRRTVVMAGVFSIVGAMVALGEETKKKDEPVEAAGMEERVTVTATRLPADGQDLSSVPAPVSVFTKEEIEASGALTLQEFFAAHTSFNVYDQVGNTAQSTVALRGFSTSNTLALVVDGVRVNEPDDNRAAFDLVPIGDVERIEVVRGNYSSVYGGGTLAGVINVITKSGEGSDVVRASGLAGSWDSSRLRASSGQSFERLSYYVGVERTDSATYRESADTTLLAVLGKVGWTIRDGHELGFSLRHGDNDIGAAGALAEDELREDRRQNVFNRPDGEQSTMNLALLEYRAEKLPAGFTLRGNVSFRTNDVDILTTGRSGLGFLTRTAYDTAGLTVQAGHAAGTERVRSSLAFGADLRQSDFAADPSFADPDGNPTLPAASNQTDERISGLFAEESLSFGPRWGLSLGVRYDSVRMDFIQDDGNSGVKSFQEWSPRLGVNFNPTGRTGVYASAAQSFLPPTVNQLFAFAEFGSNEDLLPQTSTDLEIGLRQALGERGNLEVNLFRIDVDDEIQFVYEQPENFIGENRNVGRTRRQGLEILAQGALSQRLRGYVEYTLIDATYREPVDQNTDGAISPDPDPDTGVRDTPAGARIPMVPRNKLAAMLKIDLTRGWALNLRDVYVSGQALDGDNAGTRPDLPSYNVFDIWARYGRDKWEAFLKVRNLFDTEYSSRGITSGAQDFFTPAPGRSITLGVAFRLAPS